MYPPQSNLRGFPTVLESLYPLTPLCILYYTRVSVRYTACVLSIRLTRVFPRFWAWSLSSVYASVRLELAVCLLPYVINRVFVRFRACLSSQAYQGFLLDFESFSYTFASTRVSVRFKPDIPFPPYVRTLVRLKLAVFIFVILSPGERQLLSLNYLSFCMYVHWFILDLYSLHSQWPLFPPGFPVDWSCYLFLSSWWVHLGFQLVTQQLNSSTSWWFQQGSQFLNLHLKFPWNFEQSYCIFLLSESIRFPWDFELIHSLPWWIH